MRIASQRMDISSDIFNHGRSITPVFEPHRRYKIPMGIPLVEALKLGGAENCDFRPKLPFTSKTVRDRPMVIMDP